MWSKSHHSWKAARVQKVCKIAKSRQALTTTFVKGNPISKHSPLFRSENVEEQKHIGKYLSLIALLMSGWFALYLCIFDVKVFSMMNQHKCINITKRLWVLISFFVCFQAFFNDLENVLIRQKRFQPNFIYQRRLYLGGCCLAGQEVKTNPLPFRLREFLGC